MLIDDLYYFKKACNYTGKYSGLDHPKCKFYVSTAQWKSYPVQDFDYKYNSWGFRGPEYKEFIGKPVNICLGDSFTANLGGPLEHSWCSQLAEKFDIPTLNLGMDGAGNDAIRLVYDRACKLFDVQNTFVMYSFLHRRLQDKEFIHYVDVDNNENIEYFLQQRISNAYETALPGWCWTSYEYELFVNNFKIYIFFNPQDFVYANVRDKVDQNRARCVSKSSYNNLKGNNWPTFKDFIKGVDPCPEMLTEKFGAFLENNLLYSNRDGYHSNKETNKVYADYFYNQWKQKNES